MSIGLQAHVCTRGVVLSFPTLFGICDPNKRTVRDRLSRYSEELGMCAVCIVRVWNCFSFGWK